ncbi:MAG: T9SS type A sorting domain-containing protein [Chitinophagaceae bacterium]
MRKLVLHYSVFIVAIFFTINLTAQIDRFAYAVTDLSKEGSAWNALRKLDLHTGKYSTVLLNGVDQKTTVFDATTKKPLAQTDEHFGTPFNTGVAAMAFDKKNNRLYYSPMYIDQLRYIDLKTMKVYYVTDQPFTSFGAIRKDDGKVVTRMVIAPDGNGYAVTNDGKSLIQFTTGKKLNITQLGSLVDDPSNNGVSIHNGCSSYGGDMIADDKGNLYIISARNNVFKVNTITKVASYIGAIKGLSPSFTVNGAVVNAEGDLLVSSAVDGKAYYIVNPKNWEAQPYQSASEIFRSSDLANSNYLSTIARNKTTEIPAIKRAQSKSSNHIQVYPNPITENRFIIQFTKVPAGDYTIEVTDVLGRRVVQKQVNLVAEDQTQPIALASTNANGIYLVKVIDKLKKSVFEQKVMVQ